MLSYLAHVWHYKDDFRRFFFKSVIWKYSFVSFAGRTYSVTNTCNIDGLLFAIYVIFSTESIVRDIILNSPNEPFLSLRKTLS